MPWGLPPAPRWAWVAMVAGVIAIAVMLPIAAGRGPTDLSESRSTTTPKSEASSEASATEAESPPVVAIYGDNYSAGSAQGGTAAAGWPAILADRLDADVRLHAESGAGYVAISPANGRTFEALVRSSPEPEADVVVLFGSRNDTGASTQAISSAVASALETVRAATPTAEIVVIGPAWSDESPPAETLLARDAVASAATEARVTYVDPLAEGWFFGRLDLIGADAINPTDAGHAYLAGLIQPILEESLSGAAASE